MRKRSANLFVKVCGSSSGTLKTEDLNGRSGLRNLRENAM
jgi:hypothetical protein